MKTVLYLYAAASLCTLVVLGCKTNIDRLVIPQTVVVDTFTPNPLNDSFMLLLRHVESSDGAQTEGKRGEVGPLQVTQAVVSDVNSLYGTTYELGDMYDLGKAETVARMYLQYWGERYKVKTGRDPVVETYFRIWNGGPSGYKKSSTDKYWEKVKVTWDKIKTRT